MAINKLILLGGHIQALGLARQACKCGVPVYVCLKDAYSVARYSNSVKDFFIIDNDEEGNPIFKLKNISGDDFPFQINLTTDLKVEILFPEE